jgi:uncharacterized protein (TIGR02284 family)
MHNDNKIEVLNTLITINNDRIEGYETAAKETEELDLKTLFAQFSYTSQKCKQELSNEVTKLGGTPAEGTLTTGKFFRVWMDVKTALTGKDRKAILNSCEYGEDIAKETYKKVLENDLENLNAEQHSMIKAQHTLLVADHDKVKSLRNALVEA